MTELVEALMLIEALDKERMKAGQPAFVVDPKLQAVAQRRAREMADADSLDAEPAQGLAPFESAARSGYRSSRIGAEAAAGLTTPEEVAKTWLDRDAGRKHLLGDFTEVGAGYATTKEGVPYWFLLIGQPAPANAQPE